MVFVQQTQQIDCKAAALFHAGSRKQGGCMATSPVWRRECRDQLSKAEDSSFFSRGPLLEPWPGVSLSWCNSSSFPFRLTRCTASHSSPSTARRSRWPCLAVKRQSVPPSMDGPAAVTSMMGKLSTAGVARHHHLVGTTDTRRCL